MDPLPTFPLFPDAAREHVFESSTEKCDVCARTRGMIYAGPKYGESLEIDDMNICPWCIADGSAARRGITFNDAGIDAPANPAPELAADLQLVEHQTPGFETWQGNHWLTCCGRACVYLGEADAKDLRTRWKSAVPSIFEAEDLPEDELDEVVTSVRRRGSPAAYVFQCRVCQKLRGYYDED